jgi:hypothetical protein
LHNFYAYYASVYSSGLPKSPDEIDFYIEHFGAALRGISAKDEEAREAIKLMAADPPGKREEHIKKLIPAILKVRSRKAGQPGVPQISDQENYERTISDSCPECTRDGKATGWAQRRFYWVCGTKPILMTNLFCRCPYGRWRRQEEKGAKFPNSVGWSMTHDLQSLPELWDAKLNHETWSDGVLRDDVPPDEFDGQWVFLHPDDPSPGVADIQTLKNIAERSRRIDRAKASWTEPTREQLDQAEKRKRDFDELRARGHGASAVGEV